MKTNDYKKFVLIVLISVMLFACHTPYIQKDINYLSSCIYYEERIYWKTDANIDDVKGNHIGQLKGVVKENDMPQIAYMGTFDLEEMVGSQIYLDQNDLYLKTNENIYLFQYKELKIYKKEAIKTYQGDKDNEAYAVPPHFIYNNATYFIAKSEPVSLPQYFKEVGKIKETFFIAGDELTGTMEEGSQLYATDFQNRYMIVQHKDDEKYYLYENEAYR